MGLNLRLWLPSRKIQLHSGLRENEEYWKDFLVKKVLLCAAWGGQMSSCWTCKSIKKAVLKGWKLKECWSNVPAAKGLSAHHRKLVSVIAAFYLLNDLNTWWLLGFSVLFFFFSLEYLKNSILNLLSSRLFWDFQVCCQKAHFPCECHFPTLWQGIVLVFSHRHCLIALLSAHNGFHGTLTLFCSSSSNG